MKTQTQTFALAVLVGLSFGSVYAQEEQVLNSDPINVDGYLAEKQVTDGELEGIKSELNKQKTGTQLNKVKAKEYDKLQGQTEKLLESQDEYIDAKVDSVKAVKEFNKKSQENEKKLKCLLEESDSPDCAKYVKNRRVEEPAVDTISTTQAAPMKIEAPAPAPAAPADLQKPFEEIKLLPYAGVTNFQGVEKLETEYAGGLRLESNINERFSMGIGANYSQFNTQDFGGGYNNQSYYGSYYGTYGSARQINYKGMGIEVYSKLFLTRGERFRPYIGAGLGYNRMTLNYNDNNSFNSFGNQFGNEELTSSYATGSLSAGSDVMITRSIGLNLQFQYSRGFGSGSSNNGVNPYNAPDQRRLQDLSEAIINANALSIFAGAVVIF
ncbi:MAG: porin family protein [Bacteriovoracaceae bacterium]|nr:porin family protein [Bacteriovoracaceae bacterium]